MKIDTHVHSSGISKCSRVTFKEIVQNKMQAGYQGAILMNHCQPWYYEPEYYKEWIEAFIEEFNLAREYGKEVGFTFFLGIELSVSTPRWADFLLFGVTEQFLRETFDLCSLSQRQAYELCKKHGVLMVQAHPYRETFEPLDAQFMDGVEINCSRSDIHTRSKVEAFAKEHGLALTVGTDYHIPYPGDVGGLIIPDGITNSVELVNYLKNSEQLTLFIGDEIIQSKGFKK